MTTPTLIESAISFGARHQLRGTSHLAHLVRGGAPVTLSRVRTRDGLTVAADPESFIDAQIIRTGYYEREVLDTLLSVLPERGVLWDVGANIGLHAITVKHLRPDVTVVAFEPVPFTAGRLWHHAQMNGLDVRLLPIALGARAGYLPLSVRVSGNSGLSSFAPWADASYEGTMLSRVETGDDLLAAGLVPRPSVIKIDVEGYEPEVLQGLRALLQSADRPSAVVFESGPERRAETEAPLRQAGYTIAPITPSLTDEATNYVASH